MTSAITPYSYGGIWNPVAFLEKTSVNGSNNGNNVNSSTFGARIEMSLSSFSPSYTGGTATVLFRLVINPDWMDTTVVPSSPKLNISCYVGNSQLALTTKSTSYYVDLYSSNFPFDSGTILQYPLDSYQVQTNIYCTYFIYDFDGNLRAGYLNYYMAVGNTDVGLFVPSVQTQNPYGTTATLVPY